MGDSLLEKIAKSDRHVRIYALNGLAFTLANETEDIMFWCYLTASGLSWEAAVDQFYEGTNFGPKREKMDKAVRSKLIDPQDIQVWARLNKRIQGLLGERTSLRNLIGHNAVAINLYADTFDDPFGVSAVITPPQEISQKRSMVERKRRKAVKVGEPEIEAYCQNLIELVRDLESFGHLVLKGDPKHRLQYD